MICRRVHLEQDGLDWSHFLIFSNTPVVFECYIEPSSSASGRHRSLGQTELLAFPCAPFNPKESGHRREAGESRDGDSAIYSLTVINTRGSSASPSSEGEVGPKSRS